MVDRSARLVCAALLLALVPWFAAAEPAGEVLVVGGGPAVPTEWPSIVALVMSGVRSNPGALFCGGSVVAAQWILTAAHCTDGQRASDIQVLTGVREGNLTKGGKRLKVQAIFQHPLYDAGTVDFDASLLLLEKPTTLPAIQITQNVSLTGPGTLATVAGWGTTSSGGDISTRLLEVEVPVLDPVLCNDPASYDGLLTENMLCAGDLAGGIDSCQGDSGGPLTADDNGMTRLLGIVSWGFGCADPGFPGVYTNLLTVGPWAEAVMADAYRFVTLTVGAPWALAFHLAVENATGAPLGTCEGLAAIAPVLACDFSDGVDDLDPADPAVLLAAQTFPFLAVPAEAARLVFTPVAVGQAAILLDEPAVPFGNDTALAPPLTALPKFKGTTPAKVSFKPVPTDGILNVKGPRELPNLVLETGPDIVSALAHVQVVERGTLFDDWSLEAPGAIDAADVLRVRSGDYTVADLPPAVQELLRARLAQRSVAPMAIGLPESCILDVANGFSACGSGPATTQILRGNHVALPPGPQPVRVVGTDVDLSFPLTPEALVSAKMATGKVTVASPKLPLLTDFAGVKVAPTGVKDHAIGCTFLFLFFGEPCFQLGDVASGVPFGVCALIDLGSLGGVGVVALCEGAIGPLRTPYFAIDAPEGPLFIDAIGVNLVTGDLVGGSKVFMAAAGKYTTASPRLTVL